MTLKSILILLLSLISIQSFATGKTCCVCQIGLEPNWQRGFFEKGCQRWLEEQGSCDYKEMSDVKTDIKEVPMSLPQICENGTLKLGYVGHWSSAMQSRNYFFTTVAPTVNKYKLDVYWDNTACRGLDFPEFFLDSIVSLKKYYTNSHEIAVNSEKYRKQMAELLKTKYEPKPIADLPHWTKANIVYKANQTISIGMWDRYITAPTANFWSIVDLKNETITLPNCQEFENQDCLGANQQNQKGICLDENNKKRSLSCCFVQNSSPITEQNNSQISKWIPTTKCP